MTTTELITLLKKIEYGASGRPREISFTLKVTPFEEKYISKCDIELASTGDGVAGAQVHLILLRSFDKSE